MTSDEEIERVIRAERFALDAARVILRAERWVRHVHARYPAANPNTLALVDELRRFFAEHPDWRRTICHFAEDTGEDPFAATEAP